MTLKQAVTLTEQDRIREPRVLACLRTATGGYSAESVAHVTRIAPHDAMQLLRKLRSLGKVESYQGRTCELWRVKIGGGA